MITLDGAEEGERRHDRGFWGADNVQFLDLGADYLLRENSLNVLNV